MQFRTKLLSSTVLAAAAIVLAVPTASAQDIGALEKRVQALEKSGAARYVTRTKKTVSLTVSGHLYRAFQYRDNGTRTGFLTVQPAPSSSRIRWIGVGKVNDDVTLRTNLEFAVGSGFANGESLGNQGGNGTLTERWVDFTITSKSLGSINLGQGSPSQDGRYASDLSGTGIASLNTQSARLIVGGESFQNQGVSLNKTVISVFNPLAEGRQERIRYNTPRFGGFQFSVDHQNNDDWGVGAGYGASIGGVRIAAGFGYQNSEQSSADGATSTIGSVSILFPMGLSFTVAAGQSSGNSGTVADNTSYKYGKIAYSFKGSALGQTRIYVEYHKANEVAALNEEADFFAFGIVQVVEPLGAELVLIYHNIDLDLPGGAASDDINALTAGIRLSF